MIPTKHSERAATTAADMLMDFTDALFYNFKTSEASQKAFSCVAEELSICRAVVCISSANGATAPRVLFESGAPVGDSPRIEEKSLRAFDGKIYSYRIYRKQDAEPLHFVQRRMLEFVFKLLHTYLNRQTNLEMNQYARTHDLMYECLNTNGLSETFKQYKQAGFEFTDYAVVFMNVCKFKAINEKVGFENGTKVLVGPENVAQELKDTSVVMTKFDIGDGMQGMIGVVGPTRMDYAKVTARLSYFAESLSKMFAKPDQAQLPAPQEETQKEA